MASMPIVPAGGRSCQVLVRPADRGSCMRLNPPTVIIFMISLLLAFLAIMTKLQFLPIPRHLPHQEFWLAITAYFVLMVGNVVKGL